MKRAAIYARHLELTRIENQIDVCKNYAGHNGIAVSPNQIYIDTESSDVIARAGLSNLMLVLREKQIDVILVEDFSRFSHAPHQLLQVIKETKVMGVELHSVADGVNATEEFFLIQLRGIINEIYIDDLRKSTLRGQLGQKERGFFTGEKTFGYKSEPSGIAASDGTSCIIPKGMVCSECGGLVGKVSGKGGGYYGCLRARKGGCINKWVVSKKKFATLLPSNE